MAALLVSGASLPRWPRSVVDGRRSSVSSWPRTVGVELSPEGGGGAAALLPPPPRRVPLLPPRRCLSGPPMASSSEALRGASVLGNTRNVLSRVTLRCFRRSEALSRWAIFRLCQLVLTALSAYADSMSNRTKRAKRTGGRPPGGHAGAAFGGGSGGGGRVGHTVPVDPGYPEGWRDELAVLVERQRKARDREKVLVAQALAAGATWSEIGKALGVSRQTAHRKYRGLSVEVRRRVAG